jgi:hypothetical protein
MYYTKHALMVSTFAEVVFAFMKAFHGTNGIIHIDMEPIADIAVSAVIQIAIAYFLIKIGQDKCLSFIVGDAISNLLLIGLMTH